LGSQVNPEERDEDAATVKLFQNLLVDWRQTVPSPAAPLHCKLDKVAWLKQTDLTERERPAQQI
jgi:hypothetical protein